MGFISLRSAQARSGGMVFWFVTECKGSPCRGDGYVGVAVGWALAPNQSCEIRSQALG